MHHKITLWREIRGYSQRSLARKMHISQGYLSKVEAGKKSPTVRMLFNFADALDIPICELFPEEYRKNCPYKHDPEAR